MSPGRSVCPRPSMTVIPGSVGMSEVEDVETSRILPVLGEKTTVAEECTSLPSKSRTSLITVFVGTVDEGPYLVSNAYAVEFEFAMFVVSCGTWNKAMLELSECGIDKYFRGSVSIHLECCSHSTSNSTVPRMGGTLQLFCSPSGEGSSVQAAD